MKHETIRACSIWRALDVVGDVPVMLILEQAFLGRHRFDEFVEQTGVARSVVSNRLQRLVEAEVLEKQPARHGGYRLTQKGLDLFPVALMILRWQHRWEAGSRDINVSLIHRDCGQAMQPIPACRCCGSEVVAKEVDWMPGPGLSQVTPVYARRRMQTAAASAKRGNRMMVDSVIELFGDRWSTLVVRACFTGIHRFDEIQRDSAMATNILSDRLSRLQAQGILKTQTYSTHLDRFEYRLTEKGRDLYPVLLALLQWGDVWYSDAKGPPLLLDHRPCGMRLEMVSTCGCCNSPISASNLQFRV